MMLAGSRKPPRRRPLLFLIIPLLLLAGLAAYFFLRPAGPLQAVSGAPPALQDQASAALASAGYAPLDAPAWAGLSAQWRAPGYYKLFFAAGAEPDIYCADVIVTVDAAGQIFRLARITRVTDTPDGAETPPALSGGWMAYATRAFGAYQSVTCAPLDAPAEPRAFVLAQPAQSVQLAWRGPTLNISADGRRWSVEPASGRIEPADGGLTFIAPARGEMPFLPRMVSRIRELPGVGPEKIALLENVFFTLADWVSRLTYKISVLVHAAETPAPTPAPIMLPTAIALPAPTATATETPAPTATLHSVTPAAPPSTAPTASPTWLPAPSPGPSLSPSPGPSPSASPTPSPTPAPAGRRLADGVTWLGNVQPDPQRPFAVVDLIEIDPRLLQIKMMPGTAEPRPTTGLVGAGVIPVEDWPALVASFNGGFAAMHGHYGMMVDRKVYLPARDGVATLAVYEDGSIRMGTWGKDLRQTPDMVSYRQNCPPLIENGQITAETGKLTLWGLSVSNQVYLFRSGLGITAEGKLIYMAGRSLSAYTLARALQMAGAIYAMQLDVDEWHVVFITYDVQPAKDGGKPKVTGHKLHEDMRGYDNYFLQPYQLDFFYLLRRPQPLQQAVRTAPTAQAGAAGATPPPADLPGRIAFASLRDGNWEIYVMPANQPAAARRLTNHPADDLYPAWSPDGSRLAFSSRRDGNAEIYALELAGGKLTRVTSQPSEEWRPAWSPDGGQLAYQSDRNGQSDIYISGVDGAGERRLTVVQGNNEAPDWSPDGRLILFDSDLDVAEAVHASINLYTIGVDGQGARRLVAGGESPRWSPDGKRIAFTALRGGRWQVLLANADGSGVVQLTQGAYDARYPAWSPDGRWIAFAGNAEGHWELYIVPAAGGAPTRLTFGATDSSYPAWGS